MTNPNDPHGADFRATLPSELQSLDRELSAIRIEERPSFGPELEGELSQAWRSRGSSRSRAFRPWGRALMAAAVAGLMIAGVSVPSARAAVFQLVRTVAEEAFPAFFTPEVEVEPLLPEITAQEPEAPPPEPRTEVTVSPVDASEEVETPAPDFQTLPEVTITFPAIVSRPEAERIIASHYPVELREAGIEGSVNLQFWLEADGSLDNIQASGNLDLQAAAMLAVREIEFRPATRNGVGVATWVQVDVHFFALTGAGIIGPDSTGSGG